MAQTNLAIDGVELTVVEDRPTFDLFAFMEMSHENRIGGATLERFEHLWEEWCSSLSAYLIDTGKIKYLVVWLPQSVEELVDKTWKATPSEGFLLNSLAQFLCMSFIQLVLPEVDESSCAPSPRPTPTLRACLEKLGVPYKSPTSSLLSLQYAIVTHYPYRGGCEICHLQDHCPKGQGRAEDASVVLPGYEHKVQE
ncbi:MAG: hypothetical protein IJU79_01245 [Desulfovibrionaceae bacterium]|nr:hypothetical protein [Desulfovibrionaceae bacterium]